jgi:hypothetical protein
MNFSVDYQVLGWRAVIDLASLQLPFATGSFGSFAVLPSDRLSAANSTPIAEFPKATVRRRH